MTLDGQHVGWALAPNVEGGKAPYEVQACLIPGSGKTKVTGGLSQVGNIVVASVAEEYPCFMSLREPGAVSPTSPCCVDPLQLMMESMLAVVSYVRCQLPDIQKLLKRPIVNKASSSGVDIHIHGPLGWKQHQYTLYGGVAGMAVIALAFGICPPTDIGILGQVNGEGKLVQLGRFSGAFLEICAAQGFVKVVVGEGTSLTPELEEVAKGVGVTLIPAASFIEALAIVFA